MQEVIAKLNAQKPQVSQAQNKPVEKPQPQQVEETEDDSEFFDETEPKQEKTELKPNTETEIELLNNNGRFRAEMLFQLQEINKALVVIAQVLMQK